MSHKFENFKKELIKNSFSDDYKTAVMEWSKKEKEEGDDVCICTTHIKYRYYIFNELTGKTVIVGSKCIKQFMDENIKLTQWINMTNRNEKYIKDKKLFKICDTCFNKMKLNNLNEHKWLYRCKPCYIKMKRFEENKQKSSKIYKNKYDEDGNIFDEELNMYIPVNTYAECIGFK
jgi:hypothetical protein